jgi:hypothetical protein
MTLPNARDGLVGGLWRVSHINTAPTHGHDFGAGDWCWDPDGGSHGHVGATRRYTGRSRSIDSEASWSLFGLHPNRAPM